MAQPARGWCDLVLRKHPNEDFRVTFQTTPVPLRGTSPPDLRSGARNTQIFQPMRKSTTSEFRFIRKASLCRQSGLDSGSRCAWPE